MAGDGSQRKEFLLSHFAYVSDTKSSGASEDGHSRESFIFTIILPTELLQTQSCKRQGGAANWRWGPWVKFHCKHMAEMCHSWAGLILDDAFLARNYVK